MGRKPTPLRDALIEVLRATDHPLTTAEVIKAAFSDGGRTYAYYGRVYSTLRSMEKTGLVVWHDWTSELGGHRQTLWELGPNAPAPVEVCELEAIWESS